jgi:hypothetical protein
MKRLLVLLFALILAGAGFADTGRSSQAKLLKPILTGTVYDTNHAVIMSSEVVAQSPEGKEYWATTNELGVYRFQLAPGTYRIEANAPGFCPKRVDVFRILSYAPTCSRCKSQPGLDFVLEEKPPSVLLDLEGRIKRCPQQTMIKKVQPRKQDRRSIAE